MYSKKKTRSILICGLVAISILLAAVRDVKANFVFGAPENLGPNINGPHNESCPFLTIDGLKLYGSTHSTSQDGDIWVSTRASEDDTWGPKVFLEFPVNTSDVDVFPVISNDELTIHFASNRPGGYGWLDIYVAKRATIDGPWSEADNLGPVINDLNAQDGHSLTDDGLTMYFVSCAAWPGTQGSCDIWMTTRKSISDPWNGPVNLGPTVNSSVQDWTANLSHDGRRLFFGSRRSGGYGESDLWVTRRREEDSLWEEPINLGSVVNSIANESTPHISLDGSTILFWSDRTGGYGGWDLWQVSVEPVVDFNDDSIVDVTDMCIMVDYWGTDEPLCDIGPTPLGDGVVDVQDLIVLAEHLFEETAPIE